MYTIYEFNALFFKITMLLNIANVLYDIVNFFVIDENQTTTMVRTIVSTSINVISGFCSIMNIIYNSGRLEEDTFFQVVQRLFNNDIKEKSIEIIKSLEIIKLTGPDFGNFREAIRENLLSRISKSEILQIIFMLFFYFSVVINMMFFCGTISVNSFGKKVIFLFFNIISPMFCWIISYFIILYDNINSIAYYIEKVRVDSTNIRNFTEKINHPIIKLVENSPI
jgi:hypothetical protein